MSSINFQDEQIWLQCLLIINFPLIYCCPNYQKVKMYFMQHYNNNLNLFNIMSESHMKDPTKLLLSLPKK